VLTTAHTVVCTKSSDCTSSIGCSRTCAERAGVTVGIWKIESLKLGSEGLTDETAELAMTQAFRRYNDWYEESLGGVE
jgi:hypothetical protein